MSDLARTTLTTLEVAEMMETPHCDILKKLEGRKGRKGYIQILGEGQMSVTDYFIKSSYMTAQNKEMPCFEVTRLGCDFLANKSTGEKGVLFTARYVKRFHELEESKQIAYPIDAATLKGLATSGNLIRSTMKDEKAKPYEVAVVLDSLFRQSGVVLPKCFIKVPEYEQMSLQEFMQ